MGGLVAEFAQQSVTLICFVAMEGGFGVLRDAGSAIFYPRVFGFSLKNVRVFGFYISDGLRVTGFAIFLARVSGIEVKIVGF